MQTTHVLQKGSKTRWEKIMLATPTDANSRIWCVLATTDLSFLSALSVSKKLPKFAYKTPTLRPRDKEVTPAKRRR